jgi:hypothetical protein
MPVLKDMMPVLKDQTPLVPIDSVSIHPVSIGLSRLGWTHAGTIGLPRFDWIVPIDFNPWHPFRYPLDFRKPATQQHVS